MNFIFVRHGQSTANENKSIADRNTQLTDFGKKQAQDTAIELHTFAITKILVSPYIRAMQTAEIISRELRLKESQTEIVDDLSERYLGVLENKAREHESLWYFTVEDSENIESRSALLSRTRAALNKIIALAETENILVVGHAISGFFLQQIAKGNDTIEKLEDPSQLDNAKFAIIEIEESIDS